MNAMRVGSESPRGLGSSTACFWTGNRALDASSSNTNAGSEIIFLLSAHL
ncbi:hypothetical protein ACPOL_0428 [Acidisarcina polymorpha]|uniref:Uncharacterized protein n=1 Tax=Acidisarcina polymorpha TaxID=2211140 RepID=A0A2Z5FTN2_9BACT|nr:hypothetical protein ACPOL_0428 [Acidisarcina polymorpha]